MIVTVMRNCKNTDRKIQIVEKNGERGGIMGKICRLLISTSMLMEKTMVTKRTMTMTMILKEGGGRLAQ